MSKYAFFLFFPLVLSGGPLSFAQEEEIRLLRAVGNVSMLNSPGALEAFDPRDIEPEGVELHEGDMLQTGADGFMEAGILGAVLFVAENTSVILHGDFINLVYGRVRLYGSAASVLTVRSPAAAEVLYREGDTGVDYAYEISAGSHEPVLRVYGFGGQAELACLGPPASAPSYTVGENETVFLRYAAPNFYAERGTLGEDIVNYWNSRPFARPLLSLPAGETARSEPEVQIRYEAPDYTPYIRRNRLKNVSLVTGTVFVLFGGGMAAFAHYAPSYVNRAQADIINAAGYSSMGFGIFALISSMLINPRYPAR
ncbi:MAG: hypothetical protein LBK08_09805 [Treponema sp.]|jgi:hypothetical protein|nr:hypothetical protein [Treponema sp.]